MKNSSDLNKKLKILLKLSALKQFPSSFTTKSITQLEKKDINALIAKASILSLGTGDEINQAYQIIVRLLEITHGTSNIVTSAAELIFARIGNFPGRTLLRNRYSLEERRSFSLHMEMIARETENTVFDRNHGEILLTDFQFKLFDSLRSEKYLSVSAPTSAGKSFVLNLSLSRQLRKKDNDSIVYVVPTRALISEVSARIRKTIKETDEGNAIIRTIPIPVDFNKIKSNVVYVFTQERLLSFLSYKDIKPHIDTLIIDEAHELQKGHRGIILQNAIDISLKKFSKLELLFASPLIDNPEYFLSLFNRTFEGKFFTEVVSPVSQNVFLIEKVPRKPKKLSASIIDVSGITKIGNFDLPFKLRKPFKALVANFSVSLLSSGDSVIVFSNTPKMAEDRALSASKLVKDYRIVDELDIFIKFIETEIHPDYSLIECLKKGIAFHYGNMPSLIRTSIENLFRSGILNIIFCTSTLLQGVNLPAKHIIMINPKTGDTPMNRADFLNLSGRAGRLLHEFHGNVWCIHPEDWDGDCYKGKKLQTISSSMDNIMMDGGLDIQKVMLNQDIFDDVEQNDKSKEIANLALSKLYSDSLNGDDDQLIERYRTDSNSNVLDITLEMVKSIEITLPDEMIRSNQSIRPDYLEELYLYLKSQDSLETFYPINPYLKGSKKRVEKILGIIKQYFKWNLNENYIPLLSLLAYQWVWGKSIGNIIQERISYLEKRDTGNTMILSKEIRSCLWTLEKDVRFKMVKYFSGYIDILRYINKENSVDVKDEIEPYYIYLEFGSCKKSVLNLMSMGLSRFTALYLDKHLKLSENKEPEYYINYFKNNDIDQLGIPELCKNELSSYI